MPSDIKETFNYLKTFEFEDFDKDNYSETELAACNQLLSRHKEMIQDPYILHELYRIQSIWERKYKYENSRVGQAVFSIDKLPGIFDQPATLQTAAVSKFSLQ